MRFFRHTDTRHIVAALTLLPLLVFAFFSVGTMPDFTKKGMEIVICTHDGFETVLLDEGDQKDDNGKPCAWSAYFHTADTGNAALPDVAILPSANSQIFSVAQTIRANHPPLAKPARGPPLTV